MNINGVNYSGRVIQTGQIAGRYWNMLHYTDVGDVSVYEWRPVQTGSPNVGRQVWLCHRGRSHKSSEPAPDWSFSEQVLTVNGITAAVAPGAVRVVPLGPPLPFDAARLRLAMISGEVVGYDIAAGNRWRTQVAPPAAPLVARGTYNPAQIGGRDGESRATGSGSGQNFVGVTGGQGGEYTASRGFLHDVDARVLELVLRGASIGSEHEFVRYTWESLSHPQAAMWSTAHHVTRDPQRPLSPDPRYGPSGTGMVDPDADYVKDIDRWHRDAAHLENTAFVHALATGDPAAILCVQRQLAYALAEPPLSARRSWQYHANRQQERTAYNVLASLWKNWVLARRLDLESSAGLWSAERIDAMVKALHPQYLARMQPVVPPNPAALQPGSVEWEMAARAVAHDISPAGAMFKRRTAYGVPHGYLPAVEWQGSSAFMSLSYAPEMLHLYAHSPASPWRAQWRPVWYTYAMHCAARLGLIRGTLGVEQMPATGAGYQLAWAAARLPDGVSGRRREYLPLPYTGAQGWDALREWAHWYAEVLWPADDPLWGRPVRDSFDGAAGHILRRLAWVCETELAMRGPAAIYCETGFVTAAATIARTRATGDPGAAAMAKNNPVNLRDIARALS